MCLHVGIAGYLPWQTSVLLAVVFYNCGRIFISKPQWTENITFPLNAVRILRSNTSSNDLLIFANLILLGADISCWKILLEEHSSNIPLIIDYHELQFYIISTCQQWLLFKLLSKKISLPNKRVFFIDLTFKFFKWMLKAVGIHLKKIRWEKSPFMINVLSRYRNKVLHTTKV